MSADVNVRQHVVHAAGLIGGVTRDHDDRDEVRNPARTAERVGTVVNLTPADAADAVAAARAAGPAWAAAAPRDRAAALLAACDAMEAGVAERAQLLTREHGKVLWESERDVRGGIATLRYYAGLAEAHAIPRVVEDRRGRIVEARRPIGVCAVIVPWNFPHILCMLMLGPVLAAGNTAVVKPPTYTPLALDEALRILAAHLPPGVLNVVPGAGAVVGAALAADPRVRRIAFTGSIATGRELLRAAAPTIKSVGLELGGNDPAIVLASATISDRLIRELVASAFTSSGQICYAAKRLLVHRSHVRRFTEAFIAAADAIAVGDGLDPRSTIGPLNNAAQFASVTGVIARTRASGAAVHELGRLVDPAAAGEGYFVRPHVVTGLDPQAELVTCEPFGPVIPILPFASDDEAVALANDGEYGLAASVWSDDEEAAFALGARIEAGTVFVNTHRLGASDVTMPFGGFKQSGLGRGHGTIAMDETTELQVLATRHDW